jgi:hypothetical protein
LMNQLQGIIMHQFLYRKCLFIVMLVLVIGFAPVGAKSQVQDIPVGFGFPAPEGQLEGYIKNGNITKLREHAWMLWAGINEDTVNGQPIWSSWIDADQTFDPSGGTVADAPMRGVRALRLSPARQFEDLRDDLSVLDLSAQPIEVLQSVLFNRQNHQHIRDKNLFRRSTLEALNRDLPPGPITKRTIPEFPRDAVALKLVWWPISGDSDTKLAVWDFDPGNRVSPSSPFPSNPIQQWKRFVAISPQPGIPAAPTVPVTHPRSDIRGARVVSLDQLYTIPLSPEDIAGINNIRRFDGLLDFALSRKLKVGDRIALIAMHITTKEIKNWVWATYWWHDNPDGGIYGTFRPTAVKGKWRNFLMDVAHDFYQPTEFDGSPNSVYNPYLEARFQNGVASNCMSCHGRATFPRVPCCNVITRGENDAFYDQVFPNGSDPAYQGQRVRLDFLWTMQRATSNP